MNKRLPIEVFMDPAGPYVIAPVDDVAAVQNALPSGWCVGDSWWASADDQQLPDGRWKMFLMRPEDVGGAKNAKVEVSQMPKIVTLVDQLFAFPDTQSVRSLTVEREGFPGRRQVIATNITMAELELEPGSFIVRAYGESQKEIGSVSMRLGEPCVPRTLADLVFACAPDTWFTVERDPGNFEATYPKTRLSYISCNEHNIKKLFGPGNYIVRPASGTLQASVRIAIPIRTASDAGPPPGYVSVNDLIQRAQQAEERAQRAEEELRQAKEALTSIQSAGRMYRASPTMTMFVPGSAEHVAFWNAVERYKDCNNFLTREQLVVDVEAAAVALFRPTGGDTSNPVCTIKGAFTRLRKGEQIEESIACLTDTLKQLVEERDEARTAVRAQCDKQLHGILGYLRVEKRRAHERADRHLAAAEKLSPGLDRENEKFGHTMSNIEGARFGRLCEMLVEQFGHSRRYAAPGRAPLMDPATRRRAETAARFNEPSTMSVWMDIETYREIVLALSAAEEQIESLRWMLAVRQSDAECAALDTARAIYEETTKYVPVGDPAFDPTNLDEYEQVAHAVIAEQRKLR